MALLAALPLALGACDSRVADRVARDTARANVTPIFAERFPFAPVEPGVNCIIDSASAREIVSLAATPLTGARTEAATLVVEIAARPRTLRCFAREGFALV